MNEDKMYAMGKTRTPYKDQTNGLWVVRWETNGKWQQETFADDGDAWYFYHRKFGEIKAQYQPKGRGK